MRLVRQNKFCTLVIILLILTLMLSGCSENTPSDTEVKMNPTAEAAEFAAYSEFPVTINPAVSPYQVAQDLSNVENSTRFEFSPEARELLIKNGFVVVPFIGVEFFMMYEPNRYDGIPNFITTDAMLHNYHLFFNHLLESMEKDYMVPELVNLNSIMLNETLQQYENLKGSTWENAARRNLAFFSVGTLLLDPQAAIPAAVQPEVEKELALIQQHRETALSPIMNIGKTEQDVLEDLKEDYTQYIPRGHYTKSEELQNYFQAMMWYGRLTFRLKNEDETRSAALVTLALNQDSNLQSWEKIYEPTCFFVGKSDDLGYYQYNKLLHQIYGSEIKIEDLPKTADKWTSFINEAQKLNPPLINSIPIFDENLQPDRENEIKGYRFLGQRYTLDADIFQRLVYREVKENPGGERRILPKGLDIPAAMGSSEAYSILQESGDTEYINYPENMSNMQSYVSKLDINTWTQNLYWSWLYTLQPLSTGKTEGYPSFMLNQAWNLKELNTYLGSWTELKHDTILYAKQVYAEMGGGIEGEVDDRGYVEPNPELYGRLASLAVMTREGLDNRDFLAKEDRVSLERMEDLALSLKEISEKELSNTALADEDYDLIRSFGGQLEHFWLEALKDDNVQSRSQLWDNPAALVADVATAPPDTVLEEGTGFISEIYAVVPVDGKLRIARGGVYSYYEFPWAASDRLSDKKWREMLQNQAAPESPAWTQVFTATGPCYSVIP